MDCHKAQEILLAPPAEANREESAEAQRHLTQCDSCRDAVTQSRELIALLEKGTPKPGPAFFSAIERETRDALKEEDSFWRRLSDYFWPWRERLAGAMIGLVLGTTATAITLVAITSQPTTTVDVAAPIVQTAEAPQRIITIPAGSATNEQDTAEAEDAWVSNTAIGKALFGEYVRTASAKNEGTLETALDHDDSFSYFVNSLAPSVND